MRGKRQVLGEVSLAFIGYNLMRSVQIMTPKKLLEILLIRSLLPQTTQNQSFYPLFYPFSIEKYKIAS